MDDDEARAAKQQLATAILNYHAGALRREEQRIATIDDRLEQIAAEMWNADRGCTCPPIVP